MNRITVLLCFLLSIFFTYGQEVTIGAGTTSARQPLSSYHGFARSAALYTAAEINQVGFINKLAWDIGAIKAARPVKIYLKQVESATLSAGNWTTFTQDATLVYDGLFTPVSEGFNTINLMQSFNYVGGTKNLLVLVETNFGGSGDTNDGTNGLAIKNTAATNMHFEIGKDREVPTNNLSAATTRPNLRLTFGAEITCLIPTNLAVVTREGTRFTVSWEARTGVTNYDVYISTTNTEPTATAPVVNVTGTTHTFEGLTGTTQYYVWVRSHCSDTDQSLWTSSLAVKTRLVPVNLPYTEDFEGTTSFDFTNDPVNQWHIGTAVHYGGTKSLYISKDGGVSNEYNLSGERVSQAFKDFIIPAGTTNININFDWRCKGEGFEATKYDYFRVWAVPVSYTPTAGTQIEPATDRVQLGRTEYNNASNFVNENIIFDASAFAGQAMRLVFEWRQDISGGNQPPAAIDNLNVTVITCYQPTALTLGTTTGNSLQVNWPAVDGVTSYDVYIGTTPNRPTADTTVISVTGTTHTFEGLNSYTQYYIWVRSHCSDTNLSLWTGLEARTALIPVAIPYTEDFEAAVTYGYSNDSTNKWYIGTGTNNGGTKALYISNDAGTTNAYTQSVTGGQTSHAFKDFTIPAGILDLEIGFDWRCVGEGTTTKWDYFRVWAVPASFTPVAGAQITAATDRIQLGQTEYNQKNTYTREQIIKDLSVFAGQTMRLVFEWKQDTSGGDNPPAAIDNLEIKAISCNQPRTFTLGTVTDSEATVNWTGVPGVPSYDLYISQSATAPAENATVVNVTGLTHTFTNLEDGTVYYIWIRSHCSATDQSYWVGPLEAATLVLPVALPFTDNFEEGAKYGYVNDPVNKWVIGTATNNGGTKALYISNDNGVTNNYETSGTRVSHVYKDFIIPTGINDLEVSFDWRCMGEGIATRFDYFRVWAVPVDFTPVRGTQITAATNRIQLGATEYNQSATYLAERIVRDLAVFAGQNMRLVFEWRQDISGGTQPPAAIDNLSIKVITCSAPRNAIVTAVTQNTATVSWTPIAGQTTYEVYYATTNTPPGDVVTGAVETTTIPYTITGLTPNTEYFIWVRTVCSATDKSSWERTSTVTGQIPGELPYNEDFEGEDNWAKLSNSVNKWVIGTAVQNGGTKSLYITKDNGATNTYDVAVATVAHAYRDIAVPANTSEATISFDWHGVGEGTTTKRDYFRVWLVPNTVLPTVGQQLTAGTNRVRLGGDYNNQETFIQAEELVDLSRYAGQTMRIVFEWRQDGSAGTQPPAAIDNIRIKVLSCPVVINLQAEPIEGSIPASALLTWQPRGSETQWEVFVVGFEDTTIPGDATTGIVVNQPRYVYQDPDPANPEDRFYKFYVRPICSDTDKGKWSKPGVISFIPPPGCAKVDADIEFSDIEGLDKNENGDYVICDKGTFNFTLGASYYDILKTNKYKVDAIEYRPPFPFKGGDAINLTEDDKWSSVIDLGFDFCFFGNSYDKVLIGTNGMITFSIKGEVPGGRYTPFDGSGYSYTAAHQIPIDRGGTTSPPYVNAIHGVMQDMYPDNSPEDYSVNYQIIGKAPCRTLVFNMYHMGLFSDFSCPYDPNDIEGTTTTSQIVLYEGTNIIEVYVKNRQACTGFNGGSGLIGIQNENGTVGYAPPGRNSGPWNARNEAWRFTPDGDSTAEFLWEKDGEFFSSETTIDIKVTESVKYTAKATYEICGEITELTKEFNFVKEDFTLGTPKELLDCAREPGELNVVDLSDNDALILGELDQTKYTLAYFDTEENMHNNENALDKIYKFTGGNKTIYAKVTNKNTGCSVSKTFRVVVQPPLDVTVLQDVSVCGSYTFPMLKEGEAYYTKKLGAGTKYEGGDVLSVVGTHELYIYRVDDKGCYGQSQYKLEIVDQPVADKIENMTLSCEVFTLPELSEYNKYFTKPNGEGQELIPGLVIFEPTTIYIFASNKGKNGAVCVDESSFTIDFDECPIPKGISPNGDGLNDSFDLSEHGVSKIQIFNRNGIEVYSHGRYNKEWMGQDKSGNKLPSGTYYYVIVSNGKMRTGWVQINY